MCPIRLAASSEAFMVLAEKPEISWAEFWLRSASFRTSPATTAKPLPASPARAASMAALSASRLVCLAISSMKPMRPTISFMVSVPWVMRIRSSDRKSVV